MELTLEAESMDSILWQISAVYGIHPYLKGRSSGMMLFLNGPVASKSSKHRINSRSSTQSEIIGVDDRIPGVLWMFHFLSGCSFEVNENIVYQDNQSLIPMERNEKYLCGKKTHNIDLRYFFINDRIKQKKVSVKYFPVEEITRAYFIKPLQGALFR